MSSEADRWRYRQERKTRRSGIAYDLTCPTCKTAGALTPWQASQHYQCDRCADRDEGSI